MVRRLILGGNAKQLVIGIERHSHTYGGIWGGLDAGPEHYDHPPDALASGKQGVLSRGTGEVADLPLFVVPTGTDA